MQRFEHKVGYVLHSRPYQETSLLLELFTREHGRFGAIAKGARRPKARARGLLQPFVPLLVSCSGRSELLLLKDFDSASPMHFLQGRRLISGFYTNELLMRVMHRFDPHPELFDVYRETLQMLEKDTPEQVILRVFEKALLKAIGYELQLTEEAETGNPVNSEEWYLFDPEKGPMRVLETEEYNQEYTHGSYNLMTHFNSKSKVTLFKGKSLLALSCNNFQEASTLLDAKRILRAALRRHLGGRELESRRLL